MTMAPADSPTPIQSHLHVLLAVALSFLGGMHFERIAHRPEDCGGSPTSAEQLSALTGTPLVKNVRGELARAKRATDAPVEKIILLGERHSGTNWIEDHLEGCFGTDVKVTHIYKRMKHWFQEEDVKAVPEDSAVVVAMFRDPYDWVEAMRVEPHHSIDHIVWNNATESIWHNSGDECWRNKGWQQCAKAMEWKEFVTTPWIGKRGPRDRNISATSGGIDSAVCFDDYSFREVAPCSEEDSPFILGLGNYKYDLQHDGSERGFASIIDLRRAKILNHLSVADFLGTRAFFPFRYEDLRKEGTASLIQKVEEATGLGAKCNATIGTAHRDLAKLGSITNHDALPDDFVQWMTNFVDWEVEGLIGYTKRGEKQK